MAVKKAAAKTTALTKWDERFAQQAKLATKIEENVGGGQFIGTARGTLRFRGADVPGNEMNVVIVDHILENALYEGAYDPDNPQPPVCFAFGRDEKELRPHEASAKPQNDTCKGCPMNEFGTADVGRGKACKNIRRLALITEGDLADVAAAEVAYLKPPVTSVKGWAGYVRQLDDVLQRPPLGVVTNIKLVPDSKSQFKTVFTLVGKVEESDQADGDVVEALFAKQDKVAKEIDFPYVANEEAPARPAKPRGKAAAAGRKFSR